MNENLIEIVFLLDRSGSMSGLEDETIKGFNSFIEKQKQLEGQTIVTTVLFDDIYELLHIRKDIKDVGLTAEEYFTRGSTALLDAIGLTIDQVGKRLKETQEQQRPGKVIFVITTDGQENASRTYSYKEIQKMIRHQENTYNWAFIFLGANINVEVEAGKMGIRQDNAIRYNATAEGTRSMYKVANEYVSKYRQK